MGSDGINFWRSHGLLDLASLEETKHRNGVLGFIIFGLSFLVYR